MFSRDHGSFDPTQKMADKMNAEPKVAEQKELSPKSPQERFDALCVKLGVDPKQEVDVTNMEFMLRASVPGSKEWLALKFDGVRGLVRSVETGDGIDDDAADSALTSWEGYNPLDYNQEEIAAKTVEVLKFLPKA